MRSLRTRLRLARTDIHVVGGRGRMNACRVDESRGHVEESRSAYPAGVVRVTAVGIQRPSADEDGCEGGIGPRHRLGAGAVRMKPCPGYEGVQGRKKARTCARKC